MAPIRCNWWVTDDNGVRRCRALVSDLDGWHAEWHASQDGHTNNTPHTISTERTV